MSFVDFLHEHFWALWWLTIIVAVVATDWGWGKKR